MMNAGNTSKQQGHACGCHHPMDQGQHMSSPGSEHSGDRSPGSALDILDVRFARGEIEKAEYEEKKQLISQRPVSGTTSTPEAGQLKAAASATPNAVKSSRRRR
jgi:hypothetical protein